MPEKLITELPEDQQRALWLTSECRWDCDHVEDGLQQYIAKKYPMVFIRGNKICWDGHFNIVDTELEFVSLPREPDMAALLKLVEDIGISYEYRHALGVVFHGDVGIAVDRHGRVKYLFESQEFSNVDALMGAFAGIGAEWSSFDYDMPLSLDQLYGEHYHVAVCHVVYAATVYLARIVEDMRQYLRDEYKYVTSFEYFLEDADANELTVEVDDEDA